MAAVAGMRAQPAHGDKTRINNILKAAGVWCQRPGFAGQGTLLVDTGYALCTPDALHGLGRVIGNVYGVIMLCLKWKVRGKKEIFSNRIKSQIRIRPPGRPGFRIFPAVRRMYL